MSREHFCSLTWGWEPLGQTSFAIYVKIYYLLLYHQLFLMWKEKPIFKTLQKKLPLNLCKYLQIIGFFVVPYKLWNWIELFFFFLTFFLQRLVSFIPKLFAVSMVGFELFGEKGWPDKSVWIEHARSGPNKHLNR